MRLVCTVQFISKTSIGVLFYMGLASRGGFIAGFFSMPTRVQLAEQYREMRRR